MRLLEADASPNINNAWVLDLDDEFAWPQSMPFSDICLLELIQQTTALPRKVSSSSQRKCDEAWSRLQPLIDCQGQKLYEPRNRKYAIEAHAQTIGCSKVTIYKDLRRYWQRGQTKLALLPDFNKSGKSLMQSVETGAAATITSGRGRKPRQGYAIYQLTNADTESMRRVVETEYLTEKPTTVVDAYTSLVNKHYRFADGNQELHVNPLGDRPSLRQFHRFLLKNYDVEKRTRMRKGDSDFEKEDRSVLGTIMTDCLGVGHFYEIDATIVDLYLVSSVDIKKIIGKPTLYLIIDRKSRLITGFYFGLENASWVAAMQSILSISEDKRSLCGRYEVEYRPEDWPAHQVFPMEFLADRGDMISKNSSSIADGLATTVTNLPGKRPDWKPLVECGFRLFHNSIRPITPAYDPPSNATRRRGKHYEKDACMNIREFGKLALEAIIAYNRKEILAYDLTNQELLDGVRPSPIALWNHGIATRSGLLTRYPEEVVRFALLPKGESVVTEHGIEFKGCFYSFAGAVEKKWFERARKKRFKVNISFDKRIVDSIYVHPIEGNGEPQVATLTERSNKHSGLSFDEVHCYEVLRRAVRQETEFQRLQNTVDFINRTHSDISVAKKKLKDGGIKVARTARRADIKEVRALERSIERKTFGVIVGGEAALETADSSTTTVHKPTTASTSIVTKINASEIKSPPTMQERVAAARARMQA